MIFIPIISHTTTTFYVINIATENWKNFQMPAGHPPTRSDVFKHQCKERHKVTDVILTVCNWVIIFYESAVLLLMVSHLKPDLEHLYVVK